MRPERGSRQVPVSEVVGADPGPGRNCGISAQPHSKCWKQTAASGEQYVGGRMHANITYRESCAWSAASMNYSTEASQGYGPKEPLGRYLPS